MEQINNWLLIKKHSDLFSTWATSAFLAFVCYLVHGYAVYESDQAQYFLQAFTWIDPNFAANDWFIHETKHWHYAFSSLIYLFKTTDLFFEAIFATHFFISAMSFFAILHLAESLNQPKWVGALAALLIIFFFNTSYGMSGYFYPILTARYISNALIMLAISYSIRQQLRVSVLFLALVFIFHNNNGINAFAIFFAASFFNKKITLKQLFDAAALFFIITSPMWIFVTWPLVQQSLLSSDPQSAQAALDIIFNWRSGHHYLPHLWPKHEWFPLTCLLFATLCNFKSTKPGSNWILVILLAFGIVLTTTYIVRIDFFIRLYLWNMSVMLLPLTLVSIIGSLRDYRRNDNSLFLTMIFLCLPTFSVLPQTAISYVTLLLCCFYLVILAGGSFFSNRAVILLGIFHLACLFVLAKSVYLVLSATTLALCFFLLISNRFVKSWQLSLVNTFSIFMLIIIFSSNQKQLRGMISIKPRLSTEMITFLWVRDNIEKGAVFIISPAIFRFSLIAERAVIANYKVTPIARVGDILEWETRLGDLVNLQSVSKRLSPRELHHRFTKVTPNHVVNLGEKYGAEYFLFTSDQTNLKSFQNQGFDLVYHNKVYGIARLPTQNDGSG